MDEDTGLTFADGTNLKDSSCGYSGEQLWCWNKSMSMADGFNVYTTETKTREITAHYYNKKIVYKGFTKLMILRRGTDELGNETIDVCLTWPEGGEHSIEEIDINASKE